MGQTRGLQQPGMCTDPKLLPCSFPPGAGGGPGEGTVPGEGTEPLGTAASVLFPRRGPRRPGWVTGDFRDSATVIATTDNSAGI